RRREELAALEARIEELEGERSRLEESLASPPAEREELRRLGERYEALRAELEEAYARWLVAGEAGQAGPELYQIPPLAACDVAELSLDGHPVRQRTEGVCPGRYAVLESQEPGPHVAHQGEERPDLLGP
ncbi:MAG: hypothetical protein K6T75_10495, partial [Acetobacteraceae bacterium]|nr:hypothetical protein [Acetobacteraceae bacterium]